METKKFLAEFGHIASADGGVDRLRELILNLAVSGKLTKSLSNSLSSDYIDEIKIVQNQKIESKLIKPNKKIEPLPEQFPFEIPKHWQWVRFGNLCHFSAGKTPSRKESIYWNTGDYPWFSIADMKHQKEISNSSETISQIACDKVFKSAPVKAGTLLMSFKLTIGRLSIMGVDGYHNEAIISIYPFSDTLRDYLFKCLSGFDLSAGNKAAIKGNTLNQDSISNILIAIPPKDEIPKILARLDELMRLCDQLEAQQQTKRKLQNQFRQATLQAVASAGSPFELKQHWQRLNTNFDRLFAKPEDVDEFSSHIKELAVQGLLTREKKQKPNIDKILADCFNLRDTYVSKKLMRKQKLVSIAESSVEYPENWEVRAFDEIAIVIGGVTKGRKLQGRELMSCPYLAVANVQRGFFNLTNIKTIDIPIDELEKYTVQQNDLLITEGGDWDKVGRTAIWKENIENCIHQNHIFKARVPSEGVLNRWVELVFNSNVGRDYFAGASKQTTNLASINMTQLRSFPFPIPPIEQQEEILTVVEGLEKLCYSWRNKYKRLNELSSLLANTAVGTLTGISALKEEESLKTPITELVAPISIGAIKPSNKDAAPLATLLVKQDGNMNANDLWQRFGGEIDKFYAQLKTEIKHGWIAEPVKADMLEKDPE